MRWNPNGEDKVARNNESTYPHKELLESYAVSTYGWLPEMEDKKLRITKSSLGTFDFCPKQYYFQNIMKLQQEEKDHHIRGNNVHDMTEYFFKEAVNHIDEILEEIEKDNLHLARQMTHDIIPKPPSPYLYGEDEQISTWVDWQFERLVITKGVDWFPVGNEAEVHATRNVEVDDIIVPIHMRGFIDRIFENEDGFILMELKTGKWKKGKTATKLRAEMQFYRMMLNCSPHKEFLPIQYWGWEFPGGGINKGDGANWEYEPTSDRKATYATKTVEKRMKKLVKAHLDNDFPAERNDFKCQWCDFMHLCPAWTLEDEKYE
tara:strand:- start:6831 stop:7787 length:957 start_codon:yes stop_codon:yes gene_type:complete